MQSAGGLSLIARITWKRLERIRFSVKMDKHVHEVRPRKDRRGFDLINFFGRIREQNP